MAHRDYLTGEVGQDCSDGLLSRREALHRLGRLGLGLSAATALLASCGGDGGDDRAPAGTAAPTLPAGAPGATIRFPGPRGELLAAYSQPAAPRAAVLVIHENRGLTPHFYDLVGRLSRDGYAALCVDLLSSQGGTATLTDPADAPAALGAAPLEDLVADLRAGIDELQRRVPGARVAAVGFCFGGAMTWSLLDAGESRLAAAAPFYGPAPESPDFAGARAAVLAVYAGRDTRVNASRDRAEAAMRAAGLTFEVRVFPDADHGFFNDTGPRYDAAAAATAYDALLAWFGDHLR